MNFRANQSSQRFIRECEKHFLNSAELIKTSCSENTARYLQQGVDHYFSIQKNGVWSFLKLCCISWYLPEELRFTLQLDLLDKKSQFGPEYEQRVALLLESKAKMLIYILESNTWRNPEEFFGKFFANRINIQVKRKSTIKPKKVQRHRGYRDHGSRRLGFEFLREEEKDFTGRELQNLIEQTREDRETSLQFWSGFLD